MSFRIGFGMDVHRLVRGRDLYLGGVLIPSDSGAEGHSDADVMIHAISDALLGAANLGDIGQHFPDSDPALQGIDSKLILKQVLEMLGAHNYDIVNLDVMLALQKPKISPYINAMKNTLADVMGVDEGQLSIKATTTEHLGYEGRAEGITCYAVALIQNNL